MGLEFATNSFFFGFIYHVISSCKSRFDGCVESMKVHPRMCVCVTHTHTLGNAQREAFAQTMCFFFRRDYKNPYTNQNTQHTHTHTKKDGEQAKKCGFF